MKNSQSMLQDFAYIDSCKFIPWESLRGKTVFVTGATGLIGMNLVKSLLFVNSSQGLGLRVLALVRDAARAEQLFQEELAGGSALRFVQGDVTALPAIPDGIDYIVHGASATASSFFVSHPAETIRIAVNGTVNVLELAREKHVRGMVYLSSMEVYGHPERGHAVTEEEPAGFDPADVRSCYPISKQVCESLCASYASEYGVPVMCIRLTQTFGPGVRPDDGRLFAVLMSDVINSQDIILKTEGKTERCYLYTADAVTAILTVLLKGEPKRCYNAANPDTYCSIYEMAAFVADKIAGGRIRVKVELADVSSLGYASTLYMALDVARLRALGWQPVYDLEEMFRRMIRTAGGEI